MSALEWLDAVRADLDAVSRFGHDLDERVTSREGRSVLAIADDLDDAHNALDGTAPERFDRMERALRAVLEMPVPDGKHGAGLRFVYAAALDDVRATIEEELGDE